MPAPQTMQSSETGTRIANVKSFLVRPPKNATQLVLRLEDDDGAVEPLGIWEDRDEWRPALAHEVVQHVEAAAAEERKPVLRCVLAFVSELGAVVKKMRLIHRDDSVAESQYGAQPGELTGTSMSMIIQAQKHSEMALRLMAESQVKVLQQSMQISQHACEMVNMMAQRLAETEQRSADSDARLREAQEALHRATHAETPEEQKQGMEKFVELLQPLLPVLMQRMLPAAVTPTPG